MRGINLDEIKKTIEALKPNGKLFEIRILPTTGKPLSGYFKGTDNLEKAFSTVNLPDANVFYTLNAINEDCYARKQHECFRQEKITTSDGDIVAYEWLLVDIDPKRASGVSSSQTEFENAKAKARQVFQFMKERGFAEPVIAVSGNGMHLMYSISLKNTDENKALVERCLKALDLLFSDDKVDIDTSVFNPSRISKLYGTMAQKGADTQERPHRMSHVIKIPNEIMPNEKRLLQSLADELPAEPEKPKRKKEEFNLENWMSQHGLLVDSVKNWAGGIKYVLKECPFDSSHKAPDSAIIHMDSGAICFKCLHNSCSGRDWRELRLKYEPDAYDDKGKEDDERINAGWKEHQKFNRNRQDVQYEELTEETEQEPMWETVGSIIGKPKEERVCIPTGIDALDKKIVGLAKGEISVVSGLRAAAKSTLLSQIALNAVDMDYNVLIYSGELKDTRFVEWMLCQAAGRENITKSMKYPTAWAKNEVKPLIAEWIGSKIRLYNNRYGNDFTKIATELARGIKESQADLVIIDNMAILNLSTIKQGADKYEQQTLFVEMLKNISIQCNCHVIFVAHPRKANGFLRLDDISGSGNIGNLVDNAFIVHRCNEDFKRLTAEMWKKHNPADVGGTNCVEICKDREYGNQDVFIPLWYEQYTRRMLNYENEYKCYGWDKSDAFLTATSDDEIPF